MRRIAILLGLATAALAQQPPCTGDLRNPSVIRKIDPDYTTQAKADEIEGTVSVRLTVNEQGFPTNVTLYRGIDVGLDRRAVEAVRQWRFYPATCDGEPIARPAVVDVHFQLYYPGQPPPPLPPPMLCAAVAAATSEVASSTVASLFRIIVCLQGCSMRR